MVRVLGPQHQALPCVTPKDRGKVFFPAQGEKDTYKFIQKNVSGRCPESLLSGFMQHHFVTPVLKRSMEMPRCE